MSALKDIIARSSDVGQSEARKSFHLDTYCFDSRPELTLLRDRRVERVYFTGMLAQGQSDFFIQYIDPETRTVRCYYPGFIFLRRGADGREKYVIVEVKGDDRMDDAVVQAKKEFARQTAVASGMEYRMIEASDAEEHRYRILM